MSVNEPKTVEEEIDSAIEEAMTADQLPDTPPRLFGQIVTVDAYACILVTGSGKVPFNPIIHDPSKKSIAITIEVQNIVTGRVIKKEWVHWAKAWKTITLPSMQKLGMHMLTMNNTYVAVDYVPTGRTWPDKDTGAPVKETTFVFLETFDNRDQCEAAERMHRGGVSEAELDEVDANTTNDTHGEATLPDPPSGPVAPPAGISSSQMALQAAKAMWQASGKNPTKFKTFFSKNPAIAKQFENAEAAIAAIEAS